MKASSRLASSAEDLAHAKKLVVFSKAFEKNKAWGLHTVIDLHHCNPKTIRSGPAIKRYVIALCKKFKMKRFGDCIVVDFGEDPRVSGFSMAQLIETSLISGHFVNQTNAAFIDIFSCAYYDPRAAAEFTMEFFGAKDTRVHFKLRK